MDNQQNESSVVQLIAEAARAEELLDIDDLERFAAAQAAAVQIRQVRQKDDVTMEGPCCICGKPLTKGAGYFAVMEIKAGYAHHNLRRGPPPLGGGGMRLLSTAATCTGLLFNV